MVNRHQGRKDKWKKAISLNQTQNQSIKEAVAHPDRPVPLSNICDTVYIFKKLIL